MMKYLYDSSGEITSRRLTIAVPPEVKGQPANRITEPGQVATFSVLVADESGMNFQWKFNGADIPGATSDSLLLTNVGKANEGQYSVVVTNSGGTVTSASAALMLDSDGDGLPDSWELANFGNLDQRGGGDFDGDGISNLDEFLDGTDPKNKNSLRPRITAYSDSGGLVSVAPTKLSYGLGETVTLTATAFAGKVFTGWDGDLTGTVNPITLTMNGNKTVRARFASTVPLPPGLIAFWRGETDASDLIGGHNGTFFAGTSVVPPSVTPSGRVGGAFSFDGTVHVRVPDDSAVLKPAQITVEAWIFPTAVTNLDRQTIIACGSSTSLDQTWLIGVQNNIPTFLSHGETLLEAPSAIPLNQWTHLAITFDGAIKRLYVNGAQVAWQGGLGALVYDPAVPVTIGSALAHTASSNIPFNGRVDEVSIYNRALTADEVWGIYNADFLGKNVTQPYFTSPARLPDVAAGGSYAQQLATILGTAPISFSLSSGLLPPGVTLSSTGVVSGIPSAPGIFGFTGRATDAAGQFTEQLCVLRVLGAIALPADLVAWWRAEPATGNVVPDMIGDHDGAFFSGNTATVPAYTDGKVGSAFAFDGTLYVQVPDAAELHLPELTAEAWIFPAVLSGDQTIIAHGSDASTNPTWLMGVNDGTPRFVIGQAGAISSTSPIPLNQWTHMAISFDGETRQLYVNGEQVASVKREIALLYGSAVPLTIGSNRARNASSQLFNGRVDEVSLYRRALTAAEILSVVDAGPAGKSIVGPYINSPSQLPFAIVGKPYSQMLTSIRGAAPVSFSLSTDSAAPPGLTLTSSGTLSGVPTDAGSFAFRVRATDATGLVGEQRCTLKVFDTVAAPAGLVGWWRGENDAQDSAGTSQGILRGGAGFSMGKVGQAFSLNGIDAFIEIPDARVLRPVSLTLEAWVAFDATFAPGGFIFAKPVGTEVISDSFRLALLNILGGAVGDAAGIGPPAGVNFSPIPGRFYHLAYTFDNGTKQQSFYIDGIRVHTPSITKSIGYDPQSLLLGRDRLPDGTPGFFLNGRIDEASIYNRALTGLEIASIYNAGPAGKRL
jgi:uncharacterized repeat protein (TIGR02543 family)